VGRERPQPSGLAFALRGRSGITEDAAGSGVHPAIVRAHARAFALSVIPGKRRRSSIAADNSPSWLKMVRMASASDSVTRNMQRAWSSGPAWASRGPHYHRMQASGDPHTEQRVVQHCLGMIELHSQPDGSAAGRMVAQCLTADRFMPADSGTGTFQLKTTH
jgi:hypothetical protein